MITVYIVVLLLGILLLPLPLARDTANRLKKIQYNSTQVTVYERGQSRLAIVEPFGWTFLNLDTTIYSFTNLPGRCKQNQSSVHILTPELGCERPSLSVHCYNATIPSLCSLFKESTSETVRIELAGSFTAIDAINFLLREGLFRGI